MDRDNIARLLRIILLFGIALIGSGLVAYVHSLELTEKFFWKLMFFIVFLPTVAIYGYRCALQSPTLGSLSQESRKSTVNINSKQIKQLNVPIGESSFEEKVTNDNRSIVAPRERVELRERWEPKPEMSLAQVGVESTTQIGNQKGSLTNNQIEKTVTGFLKKTNRYGFHKTDDTVINAILYQITYEYGQKVTRERLLDCLTVNHKYQTIDNMLVNIAEYEADKRDWKHIHNGEIEKVGTNARVKKQEAVV